MEKIKLSFVSNPRTKLRNVNINLIFDLMISLKKYSNDLYKFSHLEQHTLKSHFFYIDNEYFSSNQPPSFSFKKNLPTNL